MIYAALAWLVALGCAGVVLLRVRRLRALELPSTDALCDRVLAEARTLGTGTHPPNAEAARDPGTVERVVLDEILFEVDHATKRGADWARALGRVSLASGTLLSLLVMSERAAVRSWSAVAAAFLAGVTGSFGTALLGRVADQRARSAREHWSVTVRRARRRLGAE